MRNELHLLGSLSVDAVQSNEAARGARGGPQLCPKQQQRQSYLSSGAWNGGAF